MVDSLGALSGSFSLARSAVSVGVFSGRHRCVVGHDFYCGFGREGLSCGDHVAEVSEVLDVEVRRKGVEQDSRFVAGVGERVRSARRHHDQRAGGRVMGRVSYREADCARDHVEALVVTGVAVLGGSCGVGRERDLAHPQAVAGGASVLQDPHPHRAQLNGVPTLGTDDSYLHACTSCSSELTLIAHGNRVCAG